MLAVFYRSIIKLFILKSTHTDKTLINILINKACDMLHEFTVNQQLKSVHYKEFEIIISSVYKRTFWNNKVLHIDLLCISKKQYNTKVQLKNYDEFYMNRNISTTVV